MHDPGPRRRGRDRIETVWANPRPNHGKTWPMGVSPHECPRARPARARGRSTAAAWCARSP
ncbi:hypothetical protein AvCA_07990 [Azotobacter vinelandii CA]|uniref:Uncharacterized protein n=2 Tax=Azotobacter vinelandii TaxID=354 RepID=C1DML4_AZOVD|nr:hypothetical protein Avin_07990 [Azotobacter vinelandii DJ]AGK17185.1 hypothetical protein AvCA_07990 [Azotobacter vinelandii CA]AGK19523.1 hypothetical protein AvCA6_07990 [Azotobacter vinelandii CA6]